MSREPCLVEQRADNVSDAKLALVEANPSSADSVARAQARRLFRSGWRAFPFAVGALVREGQLRSRVQVSDSIWQALRQYEADVLARDGGGGES